MLPLLVIWNTWTSIRDRIRIINLIDGLIFQRLQSYFRRMWRLVKSKLYRWYTLQSLLSCLLCALLAPDENLKKPKCVFRLGVFFVWSFNFDLWIYLVAHTWLQVRYSGIIWCVLHPVSHARPGFCFSSNKLVVLLYLRVQPLGRQTSDGLGRPGARLGGHCLGGAIPRSIRQ